MKGKLYVVGIGPGAMEHMTPAARAAIEASDTVFGYKTYLDLIPELLAGKKTGSTGMRREVERCRQAIEVAGTGSVVALVSSGDAGIYGMGGLVLELVEDMRLDIEVEIVPGVSAVQAAAARLGAPLMHDFAVISLSDLLTPWPLIRKRLDAAAGADFVVALYNPKSKGRTTQIGEAREIMLRHRSPDTPVGIVRNATREGETVTITDLASLDRQEIDMFSMVIIGNAASRVDSSGRMVTPRGYAVRNQEAGVSSQKPEARSQEKTKLRTSNLEPGAARAIFVGGTGSDVGKSVLTAGLCRIFSRRGMKVAPFKAQNMALNSAVTPEGGEIGRAQALQATACGLQPHTDMNPVLLKPNSDLGSQVIVQGRPVGNMSVTEYHSYKTEALAQVEQSYRRLAAGRDLIVLEGAGSIAEINLMEHDITNLRAAAMADAPVLLVADIDRGGVFASIVGTMELLPERERRQVAGVIINKFRGDASLLAGGIEAVERRTGVPVLGVVPWIELQLPEEDSVALARKKPSSGDIRVGVVRLPRLSNYTDFDPLEAEDAVALRYLEDPAEIDGLDLLILPGSKNTLEDLAYLRRKGFDAAIAEYHRRGGRVIGICGGFQMLGTQILDPEGMESKQGSAEGLGLLDAVTEMEAEKQTHQASGHLLPAAEAAGFEAGTAVGGYEIHMGRTRLGPQARPFARLSRRSAAGGEVEDGAVSKDGRVWGSYLHGLFDDDALRRRLLGLPASEGSSAGGRGAIPAVEAELERLADHLEAHLDLDSLEKILGPSEMVQNG